MEYDVIMMSRAQHEDKVKRLAQSYTDAQADSRWLQTVLASGLTRLNGFFATISSWSRQRSSDTYERRPEFAPVVLDDRRGDSW